MNKVREFLRAKDERRCRAVDERFFQAGQDFEAIVAKIITDVNPLRIYQWGSLLDRNKFTEISDIDLAVEGLNGPEDFFKALGIAMNGSSIPVDVVEIEKIPPAVADRIRNRGKMVYERKDA